MVNETKIMNRFSNTLKLKIHSARFQRHHNRIIFNRYKILKLTNSSKNNNDTKRNIHRYMRLHNRMQREKNLPKINIFKRMRWPTQSRLARHWMTTKIINSCSPFKNRVNRNQNKVLHAKWLKIKNKNNKFNRNKTIKKSLPPRRVIKEIKKECKMWNETIPDRVLQNMRRRRNSSVKKSWQFNNRSNSKGLIAWKLSQRKSLTSILSKRH